MLPIDEDILITRYGDDPIAAYWYRRLREKGQQPDAAIREIDTLRQMADRVPYFPPSVSQQQAIQRYVDACAEGVSVLRSLTDYRAPADADILVFVADLRDRLNQTEARPIVPEKIQELARDAQKIMDMLLSHSHRSSTETSNSKPQ